MVMRYVKALRSLSKLILHPLIHTLPKFILAQNIGSLKGRDVEKKAASTKRSSKVPVGAGRIYEKSLR